VGDPVENHFPRCRPGPLDRVLLRVPVQEGVQFRTLAIQRPSTSRPSSIVSFVGAAYHRWFSIPDAEHWPSASGGATSGGDAYSHRSEEGLGRLLVRWEFRARNGWGR
jgi:hypothetical protein